MTKSMDHTALMHPTITLERAIVDGTLIDIIDDMGSDLPDRPAGADGELHITMGMPVLVGSGVPDTRDAVAMVTAGEQPSLILSRAVELLEGLRDTLRAAGQ